MCQKVTKGGEKLEDPPLAPPYKEAVTKPPRSSLAKPPYTKKFLKFDNKVTICLMSNVFSKHNATKKNRSTFNGSQF